MNDNNFNKAKSNESVKGFCVNSAPYWTSNGWGCDRSQALWSNSRYNGLSGSSGTTSQQTKSKGTPSYKSDAAKTATDMTFTSDTNGNPLLTKNYNQVLKWGNPTGDKWTGTEDGIDEKGRRYEGE